MLETRFGVKVPNLTKWRRKHTNDLTEAFNFAARPDFTTPNLPPTSDTSPLTTTAECTQFSPPPVSRAGDDRDPAPAEAKRRVRRPSGPV